MLTRSRYEQAVSPSLVVYAGLSSVWVATERNRGGEVMAELQEGMTVSVLGCPLLDHAERHCHILGNGAYSESVAMVAVASQLVNCIASIGTVNCPHHDILLCSRQAE